MAKARVVFTCQNCGFKSPKWLGRCLDCEQWNTLVEERDERPAHPRGEPYRERQAPVPLAAVSMAEGERAWSRVGEFDRVLGGGLVKGSAILIGGDPGIGKSTLLLQILAAYGESELLGLYVTGEESEVQVKMRAERLGVGAAGLSVLSETSLERILEEVKKIKPGVLVIDSIQTIYSSDLPSAPGSVGQIRESAASLIALAKRSGLSIFLIGHVTKDGSIAGPKVLEHMVDTVLYFEGDSGHNFRVLRAVKNRYGASNEIGVFEMNEAGLREVKNPSELFLAERQQRVAGSVVVSSIEGSRPILVELQALVSPSVLAIPRRTAIGVDHNRVALLVAVLEKKMGLHLFNQDIFVNVAGGIRLDEPAADLGIVAAIASSQQDRAVEGDTVVFGEVGLAGEVRGVARAEARVKEAAKLGFKRCILPATNSRQLIQLKEPELIGVAALGDCWRSLFPG